MPWVLRGLREGVVTTRYPARPDPEADAWPGGIDVVERELTASDGEPENVCPTAAISRGDDGRLRLDRGRCVLCGRCVRARPDLFAVHRGTETARLSRRTLVVPETPDDDEELGRLREDLGRRVRALRRSVHIRHVDAGSDGSDEWEVLALGNPVYDIHRLGIFFTASPRHADVLLVTGAGSLGMAEPLARTREAMPQPTVVIAAGTDAISGGLVSPSYATADGVGRMLPVDVWVPGSPPSPFSLLHGILLALGRIGEGDRRGRTGGGRQEGRA
ncbi:ferredoxin [Streptantibioticus parmotrematis]|uniref:NADH-quinone oxidoreductase subunit B family protein n=1 Tax=Streptantibioticus parmotrematis TaxID=2873249 RepID=UPI0033D2493E